MSAPFVIPTIFTATSNVAQVVNSGTTALRGFNTAAATSEGRLNALSAPLNGLSRDLKSFVVQAAGVAAVIAGITFIAHGVAEYNTEISNLSAITGATGKDLDHFKDAIKGVADETKRSMTDVAKSLTVVDNNMPELHQNAAGLYEVTKQAVILAKASREELGPAAEALTMSMNQFGLKSKDAAAAVDAMAAGAVFGSSRISETSEALQVFGTVAANIAHATFAESVALVELGSKFEKGSEAGTRFRNILLNMTNIKPTGDIANGMRALGVDISKVSNTALPLFDRLKEISKIKGSSMLMEGLFDKRNVAMAAGLFSNIDRYKEILAATSKTGIAENMANVNTNNITGALQQLRDKLLNFFITSNQVNGSVSVLTGTVQFLTEHLDGLLNTGLLALEFLAAWKVGIVGVRIAMYGLNFVQGIATALNGEYAASCFASVAGMNGMAIASGALAIGLADLAIVGGGVVTLLALLVKGYSNSYDETVKYAEQNEKMKNGFVQISEPIKQATLALSDYNNAVKDYNNFENFKEYKKYEHSKGFFSGLANDVYNIFAHPVYTDRAAHERGTGEMIKAPSMSDYPGLDSTAAENPALKADTSKPLSYSDNLIPYLQQLIENTKPSMQFGNTGQQMDNSLSPKITYSV